MESLEFFSLVKEKANQKGGYVVAHFLDDDGMCEIFHYSTRSEFNEDWELAGDTLTPKTIIEKFGSNYKCQLKEFPGSYYYLNNAKTYLFIDGNGIS